MLLLGLVLGCGPAGGHNGGGASSGSGGGGFGGYGGGSGGGGGGGGGIDNSPDAMSCGSADSDAPMPITSVPELLADVQSRPTWDGASGIVPAPP